MPEAVVALVVTAVSILPSTPVASGLNLIIDSSSTTGMENGYPSQTFLHRSRPSRNLPGPLQGHANGEELAQGRLKIRQNALDDIYKDHVSIVYSYSETARN